MGYALTMTVLDGRAFRSASIAERNRAWRELYNRSFRKTYRLVCRYGVPVVDAEDVTQRVFIIAHRRLEEIDDIRDVELWVQRIAVKVVSGYHRWRKVRQMKAYVLRWGAQQAQGEMSNPESDAAASAKRQRMQQALERMSPKLRDVLVLVDLHDCKPSEAAEILQIPVNTVRSRRRLAHEELRRVWKQTVTKESDDGS